MKNIAIKENHLYNKAYRNGRSYVGKTVAVYVLKDRAAKRLAKENPEKKALNRLGLSVSKKLGGAVIRNRVKRILRAAYDTHKARLMTGYLIVISARGAAVKKKSTDVAAELYKAFDFLGLLSDSGEKNTVEDQGKTL